MQNSKSEISRAWESRANRIARSESRARVAVYLIVMLFMPFLIWLAGIRT